MWPTVQLGSVATFRKGSSLSKSDLVEWGGNPCIHYGELFTEYGAVIGRVTSRSRVDLPVRSEQGDVLMPTSDVTPRGLAKASAVTIEGVGLGGDILVIRPDRVALDGRFLAYVIRYSEGQVLSLVKGSTVFHLYAKDMEYFEMLLPSLREQQRIADALSDADDLIRSLETLITKKRDIKQATMQQLLKGRTRLPGFTAAWDRLPFAEVMHRVNAKAYQVPASSYGEAGRLPVVDQGQRAVVGYTDDLEKAFDPGHSGVIVFGDHTCITKFVDFKFAVGADGTQIIRAKEDNSTRFMAYALEVDPVTATGYNRHFKFLKEKDFPVPPVEEQRAISFALAAIDDEIELLQAQLRKVRDVKVGMMQQLLTGRTRLARATGGEA